MDSESREAPRAGIGELSSVHLSWRSKDDGMHSPFLPVSLGHLPLHRKCEGRTAMVVELQVAPLFLSRMTEVLVKPGCPMALCLLSHRLR